MQVRWMVLAFIAAFVAYQLHRHRTKIPAKITIPSQTESSFNFTVIGTNDLHSTFTGIGLTSYPESIKGGYSRLVQLIHNTREEAESIGELVLTIDAGDWYSGSLFDNIAADPRTPSIPQLEYFAAAKYDAVIFGNHDFDRYESALFTMLNKAENLQLDINFLTSNLLPLSADSKFLKFQSGTSHVRFLPHLIKETAEGRVGVLGYVTPDALFVSTDYRHDLQFVGLAPGAGQDYGALVELADRQSTHLKEELGCDAVVVIIHGGNKDGEDTGLLALRNVDVVMGGHTHESYLHTERGALSAQCGYSGTHLSVLRVGYSPHGEVLWRGPASLPVPGYPPQCVPVTPAHVAQDPQFEARVQGWKGEIRELLEIDPDRIVFQGNLSELFDRSMSHLQITHSFATMLLKQYNKQLSPEQELAHLTVWNKEFLKTDFLTQDPSEVTLTHGDAYNLIFFTGTKDTYTFYLRKSDVYKVLQGVFVLSNLVSPLITMTAGGLNYEQTMLASVPIISDMYTWEGVPYAEWPERVKVVGNSISAPYFWKVESMTKGLFSNFVTDKDGNAISVAEAKASSDPNEMELFLSYLAEKTRKKD